MVEVRNLPPAHRELAAADVWVAADAADELVAAALAGADAAGRAGPSGAAWLSSTWT